MLNGLDLTLQNPTVTELVEAMADPTTTGGTIDAIKGLWPSILRRTVSSGPAASPQLIVTATTREAEDLARSLADWVPADSIAVFPSWETLPHEKLSPRSDTVGQRLEILRRLAHPKPGGALTFIIAPVRAFLQPLAKGLGEIPPIELAVGDEAEIEAFSARLTELAYTRVDMVSRRGEYAVRGGIVDVFPPTVDHPLRIEFFGDEVDEIREFAVADQRSIPAEADADPLRLSAPPVRELLLTDSVRARAAELAPTLPAAADMLEKIAAGIAVEGMESLTAVLADGMEPLIALLPEGTKIIVTEPERVAARAADLVVTTNEFLEAAWSGAAAGGDSPIDLSAATFRTLEEMREGAGLIGLAWWEIGGFATDAELVSPHANLFSIPARPPKGYAGDVEAILTDVRGLAHDQWRILVLTEGQGPGQRMVEVFSEAGVPATFVEDPTDAPEALVTVTTAAPFGGFVFDDLKLAVLTEADVLGRAAATSTRDMRRLPTRRKRNQVDPLNLAPGDLVVHEQHGVGRFVEMTQRTTGKGAAKHTREYLIIEYAPAKRGQPGDRLYVPSDALDQVSRYVGGENPSLNKMGGADWQSTKAKARKAVKEIAGELIRLYSARQATVGHAYGPDTPWQRELEDAFHYVETTDQLTTIDEVKADMEKSVPMDRLICGDVGYGKTEIAVRAAFKAIQDGKQVAVLVPTTLLVQQHFETFAERYAGFPVTVGALSRFQTKQESEKVVSDLADGKLDLVIGTHRLLSGEVRFKNLGLVIIDEEQRFGVEHKETLKAMRTNVDVLAMSATPIPRTLEMAVTGIREMSTLATPPEERHPVLTYVGKYEDQQVKAAIRRELMREGQVFYIHNRVRDIEAVAARLAELVPEARIAIAHGKMNEHRLEQVIVDFWEKKYDVLVCTTIVETGIDIANANTLIIDHADRYGLSQLHQLRGRVGRGRERAYAYFLYPADTQLTETALDRLTTLAAHTELGAGMQVAMKDLEIRGAGNLLGGQQSGHIEGVGFDLYVRLVGEAVANFRGEDTEPEAEMRIELPVDAHLPAEYVDHERLRLEAYRKLAAAANEDELQEVLDELVDRYGPYPEAVGVLADVARLRIRARASGVNDIVVQGNFVRFGPVELEDSQVVRLKRLYPKSLLKPAIRSVLVPKPMDGNGFGAKEMTDSDILRWAHQFLDAILPVVPAEVVPSEVVQA
ncbi:transcription-repair coupling factor [Brevibacterium casei CIP 102111]|uniref:Transcription-repair-coupling factor n=4 Tax=Bacteria TaxID=2 RepID=A0A269Z6A9_9MICO|nr:transcription-repair coupling factor [Brevibacterium casei]QPR39880.1 transcription-repair coupling factor [Brevibacterium casei]QPR44044.1 transcription-repair coupling factor [Brevibacterium casei]SMX89852.1 transcription-repair coupling factor [Brevibacterium casei CIP 102111]VEW10325.1 Transcription-repair-coupling factor [Brevibacterium casei]